MSLYSFQMSHNSNWMETKLCLEEKPCTPKAPWFCIVLSMNNYIYLLIVFAYSYTVHKYPSLRFTMHMFVFSPCMSFFNLKHRHWVLVFQNKRMGNWWTTLSISYNSIEKDKQLIWQTFQEYIHLEHLPMHITATMFFFIDKSCVFFFMVIFVKVLRIVTASLLILIGLWVRLHSRSTVQWRHTSCSVGLTNIEYVFFLCNTQGPHRRPWINWR